MNEVTHTPGPWFLFGNPAHCVGGPHPDNGTGGIAMCGMRLRSAEEAAANARLIAAAPELLAACVYFRDMLLQEFPDGRGGVETMAAKLGGAGGYYALRLVTDALAKAKPAPPAEEKPRA